MAAKKWRVDLFQSVNDGLWYWHLVLARGTGGPILAWGRGRKERSEARAEVKELVGTRAEIVETGA